MCKARELVCCVCLLHMEIAGLIKCSKPSLCDESLVTIFFKYILCDKCDKKRTTPVSPKTLERIVKMRRLPRKGRGAQNIAKREKKILPIASLQLKLDKNRNISSCNLQF